MKTIYSSINGNLGNQMFQYAFSHLIERSNAKNKFFYCFHCKFQLDVFGIEPDLFDISSVNVLSLNNGKVSAFLHRISDYYYRIKKSNNFLLRFVEKIVFLCCVISGYYPGHLIFYHHYFFVRKNNYIFGTYENKRYLDKNKDYLKKLFYPVCGITKSIEEIVSVAKKTNSVCITIRRGDFLEYDGFYVCDESYFYSAINLIKSLIINPQFIVFSNDIEWCKNNMSFPDGTLFENGNNSLGEKIIMMTSCKNFIISNSTFSWWCQYLSNNNDKIVIAPKYWRKGEKTDKKLTDKCWVLLDNMNQAKKK